jgi:hypothetical protein
LAPAVKFRSTPENGYAADPWHGSAPFHREHRDDREIEKLPLPVLPKIRPEAAVFRIQW